MEIESCADKYSILTPTQKSSIVRGTVNSTGKKDCGVERMIIISFQPPLS